MNSTKYLYRRKYIFINNYDNYIYYNYAIYLENYKTLYIKMN